MSAENVWVFILWNCVLFFAKVDSSSEVVVPIESYFFLSYEPCVMSECKRILGEDALRVVC